MTHVFFIHSYILSYVAQQVIRYKDLSKEDCVFLSSRSIDLSEVDIKVINVEAFFKPDAILISRYFWRGRKCLNAIDKLVESFSNRMPFIFYIPHTADHIINIIRTHQNCQAFSFIEEGLASYFPFGELNSNRKVSRLPLIKKINRFLNYGTRFPIIKFYDEGYQAVYGLIEESFPGFRNKEIIGLPFRKYDSCGIPDNAHILVLDGLYECGVIALEDYIKSLIKVVKYLESTNIKTVYYKFHPLQIRQGGSAERIRKLFNNMGLSFQELSPTFNFENVYLSANNLTFYISLSSVGLYASICNHKVNSFIDFLENLDEKYYEIITNLPQIFKEKISFITLPASPK